MRHIYQNQWVDGGWMHIDLIHDNVYDITSRKRPTHEDEYDDT